MAFLTSGGRIPKESSWPSSVAGDWITTERDGGQVI